MAQFSAGGRMTNAPTSTLPGMSAYAGANSQIVIRQIEVINTTTTACVVAIQRLTSAGTQGANIVEFEWAEEGAAPTCTVVNSHTSTGPTLTTGEIKRTTLGAAAGAAYIFVFSGSGLIIPKGTGNGIALTCPTGTGQICDVNWEWDE